jgi:hypothetical protein
MLERVTSFSIAAMQSDWTLDSSPGSIDLGLIMMSEVALASACS